MRRMNKIDRLEVKLVQKFNNISTATVHEVLGKRGAMDSGIKPLASNMEVCGVALTVKCPIGDNLTIHAAISIAKQGDVLVVDAGKYKEAGAWGEITTVAALNKGIRGLVIDGGVRDVEAICEHNFPVFTRSISVRGTVKKTLGDINGEVICGGILVHPGDIVLGDRDGVVVIPKGKVEEVYEKGVEKEKKEREVIERIKRGELTIDILGFREIIEEESLPKDA